MNCLWDIWRRTDSGHLSMADIFWKQVVSTTERVNCILFVKDTLTYGKQFPILRVAFEMMNLTFPNAHIPLTCITLNGMPKSNLMLWLGNKTLSRNDSYSL